MAGIYSVRDGIIGVQSALGGRGGGLCYLLRDEFTTDRAAGAVDGTAAEPGPGTRTVVDTSSIISISGGEAVFNGSASANDGLYYGPYTRQGGTIALWSMPDRTTVGNSVRMGLSDSSVAGSGIDCGFDWATSTRVRIKSGVAVVDASLPVGAATKFAAAARATGGMLFVNISGNWTLVYVYPSGTGVLYWKTFLASAPVNFTVDSVRIPDALWLPTPLVSYGFD